MEDYYENIFYALREYDEKKYVEKFAEQYSFEYGFTSDYPSMDNVELAEGYDAISIITNPMYQKYLMHFTRRELSTYQQEV